MRTKALLLGALVGAAGLATSMAQVYSVNIVGYVNVPVPTGWSIIANPLKASPDNKISTLLPAPAADCSIYKWNTTAQAYNQTDFLTVLGFWTDDQFEMNPGEGIFIYNTGSPYTLTFVGEVMTGPQSVPLSQGWNLLASVIPQTGLLKQDLLYPPSPGVEMNDSDVVYKYNNAGGGFDMYTWWPFLYGDTGWDIEPTINVGEGFYLYRSGAAATTWDRNFNVGP